MERLAPKMLICCLALGLCALLGPVGPASAQAVEGNQPWRVLEKYGSVRYRTADASEWSQAVAGAELPLGSRIVTGNDGWVLIRHAAGNFWVEPNARFMLPSPDNDRVRQEVGNLHYRIIRHEQQRFEVETPYASLVVKGTTFDVRVSDAGTAVDVARGWIEVATPQGSRADLRAGQAARISSGAEPRLEVRPAPGQSFEPVRADVQIRPAVQPLGIDPATRDASAAENESRVEKGWLARFFDMLRTAPAPTTTADSGRGGGSASPGGGSGSGGSSSGGSDSSASGDSGSGGSGSGDSGSGDSGSGSSGSGGSGSGGSGSGGSGSGDSGSGGGASGGSGSGGSASSGAGGGGSGSASGSGGGGSSGGGSGGVGVGASVGGVGVGASVGSGGVSAGVGRGGGGVSVGANVGGIGVGVGIGK